MAACPKIDNTLPAGGGEGPPSIAGLQDEPGVASAVISIVAGRAWQRAIPRISRVRKDFHAADLTFCAADHKIFLVVSPWGRRLFVPPPISMSTPPRSSGGWVDVSDDSSRAETPQSSFIR